MRARYPYACLLLLAACDYARPDPVGEDQQVDARPIDAPDAPGVCGDGMVGGAEACDDRNTLACGTCNATCSVAVPARASVGTINAISGNDLFDGTTFVVHDGQRAATFIFDNNNDWPQGGIQVRAVPQMTPSMVASNINLAINNQTTLEITATVAASVVTVSNRRRTSLGNHLITETVNNDGFRVDGMSGGAAGDCPAGVGCGSPDDCASGVCTDGVCR